MLVAIFLASLAIYAVVSTKVEEWTTEYLLGFRLEVPQGFLDNPNAYAFTRRILLIFTIVLAAAVDSFQFEYKFLAFLAVILSIAGITVLAGRILAYNTCRRISRLLLAEESDPEKISELLEDASITNAEFRKRLNLISRMQSN